MRTTIQSLRAPRRRGLDDGRGTLPFTVLRHRRRDGRRARRSTRPPRASSSPASCSRPPRFERGLRLRHTGERLPSLPHIEMTIALPRRARGHGRAPRARACGSSPPAPIRALDVDDRARPLQRRPVPRRRARRGRLRDDHRLAGRDHAGRRAAGEHPAADSAPRVVAADGDGSRSPGTGSISGVDLDLSAAGELAPALVGARGARRLAQHASPASATSAVTRPTGSPRSRPRSTPSAATSTETARRPRDRSGARCTAAPGTATTTTAWPRPARIIGLAVPGRGDRRHRHDRQDPAAVPRAVGRDGRRTAADRGPDRHAVSWLAPDQNDEWDRVRRVRRAGAPEPEGQQAAHARPARSTRTP